MKTKVCDYCLYLDQDLETGEFFCSMNMDQDDLERILMDRHAHCPYYRMGTDYTIAKKQGFTKGSL